jgi:transcriptional regulator with GAF, ATPase, and Fis domain
MGSPHIAFPDAQSFGSVTLANENLSKQQEFEGIVGCSTALMETLDLVRTVAPPRAGSLKAPSGQPA